MSIIQVKRKTMMHVLNEVNDVEDKQDRIYVLRNICQSIQTYAKLIQYTYHPDIQFDLPSGDIPDSLWRRSDHDEYGILYRLINRGEIKALLPSKNPEEEETKYRKQRKELIFISFLEKVARSDADLIIGLKAKKLPQRRLTEKFCLDALPELFPTSVESNFTAEKVDG